MSLWFSLSAVILLMLAAVWSLAQGDVSLALDLAILMMIVIIVREVRELQERE